ncbi:MAG: hypothetical protein ACI9MR_000219 [Myxococcota bacterium]|jgi:hypothetical protein
MTTTTKPAGLLMTGAIGCFIVAAAFLLQQFMGSGLISGLLIIGGHIVLALGWGGWGKVHGGMAKVASIFAWVTGIGMVLAVVLGMAGMFEIALYLGLAATITMGLTALFGGLAFMGSKNAQNAQMAKIGGILLLIAGIVSVAITLAVFARIMLPGITILPYVMLVGGVGGYLLGGVAFLSEKG